MKISSFVIGSALGMSVLSIIGCGRKSEDIAAEAPPTATVVQDFDVSAFTVDSPKEFPLAAAGSFTGPAKMTVTGQVSPDIARTVPVISLATGRIVDIKARLGDTVKKGQLLFRVRSDDIFGGYATYQMAVADEALSRAQFERAEILLQHGAIALNDMQIAKDAEDKNKVAVAAAEEHLRLLGSPLDHPSGIVDVVAPVSGVITDQEITNAAGVQSLGTSPFTISDLSWVWIICDAYENDLATVKVGDSAEIRLNAYPGQMLEGKISNIGSILDPNIRSGKVRIEVRNPGLMRVGMFVTATFKSQKMETFTTVPASAILHLHDREFVYVPQPNNMFKRIEVMSGDELPNGVQELKSGIKPGQQVVTNALALQNTVEQ